MRLRGVFIACALAATSLLAAPSANAGVCEKIFIPSQDIRVLLLYVCFDDTLSNYSVGVHTGGPVRGISVAHNTDEFGNSYDEVCVSYVFKDQLHQHCARFPIE